jgi:hypothetical protein
MNCTVEYCIEGRILPMMVEMAGKARMMASMGS